MATGKGGGGSRLFGGRSLKDVATEVRDRGEGSPLERSPAQPTLAAAELALKGRAMPSLERENIHAVDPKRCRPWRFHNRTDAWYTRERCQDLRESIVTQGQPEPALARRLAGDTGYQFERVVMDKHLGTEVSHRLKQVERIKCESALNAEDAHRWDSKEPCLRELRQRAGLAADDNRRADGA